MSDRRLLTLKETQDLLLSVMIDFDRFCRERDLEYYMIGGTILGAVRHQGFIPWDDDIDVAMIRPVYEKFLTVMKEFDPRYEIKHFRTASRCNFVITRIMIPGTFIDNPSLKDSGIDQRLYFDIFPLDFVPEDRALQEEQRKKLKKLKNLLSLVDFKVYNQRPDKVLERRVVSTFLKPRRQMILNRLDRLMRQYSDTEQVCSMASQYDYFRQVFDRKIYGTPVEYRFEGHDFYGPACAHEYLNQLYGEDYMELPPESKRRKGFDIYLEE